MSYVGCDPSASHFTHYRIRVFSPCRKLYTKVLPFLLFLNNLCLTSPCKSERAVFSEMECQV